LGVKNNGDITGVDLVHIEQIKKEFVTAVNNPEKIGPAFYLTIEKSGSPEKAFSMSTSRKVSGPSLRRKNIDRNEDGDFNITGNTGLVTAMCREKQATYPRTRCILL